MHVFYIFDIEIYAKCDVLLLHNILTSYKDFHAIRGHKWHIFCLTHDYKLYIICELLPIISSFEP